MGWRDLVNGAMNGAVASAIRPDVETMCGQLGLKIATNYGEGRYELQFDGGEFGVRSMLILSNDKMTTFLLPSSAEISSANVLSSISYLLLMRNKDLSFGAWRAGETRNGTIGLAISYAALTSGLDAVTFGTLCQMICDEVNAVNIYLRRKRII